MQGRVGIVADVANWADRSGWDWLAKRGLVRIVVQRHRPDAIGMGRLDRIGDGWMDWLWQLRRGWRGEVLKRLSRTCSDETDVDEKGWTRMDLSVLGRSGREICGAGLAGLDWEISERPGRDAKKVEWTGWDGDDGRQRHGK